MEEPIIVWVDVESRVVRLFGKYERVIPFSVAFILPSLLSGQQVLYVSGIQEVSGDDVINSLTYVITEEDQPTEKLYIRSRQDGYVRVPELKLTFSGPKDCKPIQNIGWDLFEKSKTLRTLLMENKVEIMLESQATALRKRRPDPKSKDKALDSIILNRSVKDIIESEDMFGFEGGDGDEVSADEKDDVLTENQMILRDAKAKGVQFGKDPDA